MLVKYLKMNRMIILNLDHLGSKIGAIVSNQSEIIESRDVSRKKSLEK